VGVLDGKDLFRRALGLDLAQAEIFSDAVLDVNDEVPLFQFG